MNRVHFACFDCRKSFKQPESSNWDISIPERGFKCPECKSPMVRLGRYFKAPRRNAFRQWEKVELLYEFGELFISGTSGLSTRCKTLSRTLANLAECGHPQKSIDSRLKRIRANRDRLKSTH
jgi:hypothetical protein